VDVGGGVGLGAPAEERPHPREARKINNNVVVLEKRRALWERRHIDRVIVIGQNKAVFRMLWQPQRLAETERLMLLRGMSKTGSFMARGSGRPFNRTTFVTVEIRLISTVDQDAESCSDESNQQSQLLTT
jgi:hypothetical protein